jgi:RNA recognition motif-containing protein
LNVSAAPFNPSVGVASATHKEPISETENISPTLPKSILVQSQQQYIDYCNLYIKNLDEAVTSTDLFQHFKSFGRVVSARVIANAATNQSRGYGFVSYSRPDEAAYALNQMNGALLGSKSILVAYHEPKKPRIMPLSPKSPDTSESGSQVLGLPPLDSPNPDLGDLYHDLYSSVVSSGLVWESNSQQVTEQLARLPRHEQVNLLTQPLLLIEKVCKNWSVVHHTFS